MNGTLTSTKRGDTLFHKAHLETVLATLECIRKQEEFGMSIKYCSNCEKKTTFAKCNDILGDETKGVENVDWYKCPDMVCDVCGEEE